MIRWLFTNHTLTKTAPVFLNLRTRWSAAVVSITPRPLQPRGNDRRGWVWPYIRSVNFVEQKCLLRSALFCGITQRLVAIAYRRFRTTHRSLKTGLTVCSVTSARNRHQTPRDIPEDSRSHLLSSGGLISRTETSLIPVWKRTSDPYHIQYRDYALTK
jgi:hypothetical protein